MNHNTPTIIRRVATRGVVAALTATLLGGCMSVPALSGPAPQSPGTPQKTITQLLTQWADLTNAGIAATGDTEGWFRSPIIEKKPWDPSAEDVHLSPCGTVGSKTAHQVEATVQHDSFEPDPHPIADKLTAYWESQGFTVTRTVDWTTPSNGEMDISIRATRPDGVYYGLAATHELVSITVSTECSTHPSIDDWAREGSLRDLNAPTPTPTPSVNLGEGGNPAPAAAITAPSDLFRAYHDDAADHTAPAADAYPADPFREFHENTDNDSSAGTTERTVNDYNWTW